MALVSHGLQDQLDSQRRKVDVDFFDITIRELERMTLDGEIIRAPTYQRKFRWNAADESKFIESIFLGFPVPSIFVAANPDSVWELVDGLQRISTLLHFLNDSSEVLKEIRRPEPLRLEKLEKLSEFNGFAFAELPKPIQLHFLKRAIRVTALSDKSDPEVRFDAFERLNNGGIYLTSQEVRACVFRGKFMDFVKERAEADAFKQLLKLQRGKRDDGTIEEQVVKFFAYLNFRNNFRNNLKKFLNEYAVQANRDFDAEENRGLFDDVVDKMYKLLEGRPFLRSGKGVTPLTQFEAAMVGVAELLRAGEPIVAPPSQWIDDSKFIQASTGGSNSRTKLDARINRAKELLSGRETEAEGVGNDGGD